ncbi:MAG: PfkB family carbohydrate kinase [Solirubrobacteraceae bacterium]
MGSPGECVGGLFHGGRRGRAAGGARRGRAGVLTPCAWRIPRPPWGRRCARGRRAGGRGRGGPRRTRVQRPRRGRAATLRPLSRLLVATEGASGGRWWSEREERPAGRWAAVPPPGEVRDSYGCGDSFAAGLTSALADGRPIEHAAKLGAECAARCLTRVGAP